MKDETVAPLLVAAATALSLVVGAGLLMGSGEDVASALATIVGTATARTEGVTTSIVAMTGSPTTNSATSTTVSADVVSPEVAGMTQASARRTLRDVGLVPSVFEFPAETADQIGMVFGQEPVAGSRLETGDETTLFVAAQPEPVFEGSPDFDWDAVESVNVDGVTGSCLNGRLEADGGLGLDSVSCNAPHDFQVIGKVQIEAPGDWGDGSAVYDNHLAQCRELFGGFVGVAYDRSALFLYRVHPGEPNWANGERIGWCYLVGPRGQRIVGDAAGSLW